MLACLANIQTMFIYASRPIMEGKDVDANVVLNEKFKGKRFVGWTLDIQEIHGFSRG